jgi:CheY-like chemotaxis protein
VLLGLTEAEVAEGKPTRGRGCHDCGNTGYRGRTGVFEVVPVTSGMRTALLKDPSESSIAAAARASGVTTMRHAAIQKAMRGETTFEEVLRVSHSDALGGTSCPSCDRRLADDMIVCPWCDISLSRGHCTECARPLDAEWRVCPWCRAAAPVDRPPVTQRGEHRPRVLVVDDEEDICFFVRTVLSDVADVDTADSATTALRMTETGEYDVAVIDNKLPDLSGVELVRLLRNDVRTAALPLLLFTGTDRGEIEHDARHAGADDFLGKPVEPSVLEQRVLKLAARSPRRAAG